MTVRRAADSYRAHLYFYRRQSYVGQHALCKRAENARRGKWGNIYEIRKWCNLLSEIFNTGKWRVCFVWTVNYSLWSYGMFERITTKDSRAQKRISSAATQAFCDHSCTLLSNETTETTKHASSLYVDTYGRPFRCVVAYAVRPKRPFIGHETCRVIVAWVVFDRRQTPVVLTLHSHAGITWYICILQWIWLNKVSPKRDVTLLARHVLPPGELRRICECYRRQTTATVTSLPPTLCVDGPVIILTSVDRA